MLDHKHFGMFWFIALNSAYRHNVKLPFDVRCTKKSAQYFDGVILI